MEPIPAEDEIRITATPWLDEVSEGRRGDSLEWPGRLEGDRDLQHRERIDTPRVRHLFPVPGLRLGALAPRVRVQPQPRQYGVSAASPAAATRCAQDFAQTEPSVRVVVDLRSGVAAHGVATAARSSSRWWSSSKATEPRW